MTNIKININTAVKNVSVKGSEFDLEKFTKETVMLLRDNEENQEALSKFTDEQLENIAREAYLEIQKKQLEQQVEIAGKFTAALVTGLIEAAKKM